MTNSLASRRAEREKGQKEKGSSFSLFIPLTTQSVIPTFKMYCFVCKKDRGSTGIQDRLLSEKSKGAFLGGGGAEFSGDIISPDFND